MPSKRPNRILELLAWIGQAFLDWIAPYPDEKPKRKRKSKEWKWDVGDGEFVGGGGCDTVEVEFMPTDTSYRVCSGGNRNPGGRIGKR